MQTAIVVMLMTGLQFLQAIFNLVDLLLQQAFLTLLRYRDSLKLTVADDNGIIVAGGDPGAEFLTVSGLKVFLGRDQNIGGGVQPQKLGSPLLCQMVGNNEHCFLAKP